MNFKDFRNSLGVSLIEIMVALAIFALAASAIASLSINGFTSLTQGGQQAIAENLAQEAIEAARSIREGAWNELQYNRSAILQQAAQWALEGEGTVETIGNYSRQIDFTPVCRDAMNEITDCPGNYTDVQTKLVTITVSWQTVLGKTNQVRQSAYLTNWDSQDWQQDNWIGGDSQAVWSDPNRFWYADPNVDYTQAGEIKLSIAQSGQCAGYTWHFVDPADYVFNPTDIKVEDSMAQLKPAGEEVIGIDDNLLDTFEFDNGNGQDEDIIKIAEGVFAIAYRGVNNDGFVRTVAIDASGQITNNYLDSLEFDSQDGFTPRIIAVGGNYYAIVYRGRQSDGYIVTVEITPDGQINNSLVDSLEFNDSDSYEPQIIQVGPQMYAIIFRYWISLGRMVTLQIDTNGQIANGITDSYIYSWSWWSSHYEPDIIQVGPGIYGIVYRTWFATGTLLTVPVAVNGDITENVVDSYGFAYSVADPDIEQVSEDIFAIAYRGASNDGYVRTIGIADDGQITEPYIDSLEYNTSNGYNPQITYISNDVFGIAYHDSANSGYITILDIESDGNILSPVIDTLSFELAAGGGILDMQHVAGYVYALAYDGPNNDGFVSTIQMITGGAYPDFGPNIYPVDAYQPPNIDGWVELEELAYKDGGEVYYQISVDAGATWYYWNGNNWATAAAGQYNTAAEINEHLWEFAVPGDQFSFNAYLYSDGLQFVRLDSVSINCSNLQLEAGSISVDENWTRVNLSNIYSNPIILTGYQESANIPPASARLNNVASSYFDIRLQQTDDNNLNPDTVNYLVIEEGVWDLGGLMVEARALDTNLVGSQWNWNNYETRDYAYNFTADPMILHQVMSSNDNNWITSYVSDVNSRSSPPSLTGFRIALNGGEDTSSHGAETIGWLAAAANQSGVMATVDLKSQLTNDFVQGHDNGCYVTNYLSAFNQTPLVLSSQQEMDDTDGSWSVICSSDAVSFGLHSEEDGGERYHSTETHAVLSFADAFSYSSVGDEQAYEDGGELIASAFDTGGNRAVQTLTWVEVMPPDCPLCDVKAQIRSADTQGDLAAALWSGPAGPDDYFTQPNGQLINPMYNGDRWLQYKIILFGDGALTPVVRDIKVNYK